ncbi:MAG: peroxiredoxin family protein [Nannocystaceae bacterium]
MYCRRQLAGLQRALPELERRGATLVGISADEAPESVAFASAHNLTFSLLHDPRSEVASRYGVRMDREAIAIPSVFVLAQDGRIAWRHVGETVPDRPTPEAVLAALDAMAAPGSRGSAQPKSVAAE